MCDLGCGPGYILRYLRDRGVSDVFGIDIAQGMLDLAKELNPGVEFRLGNMLDLDMPDESMGAIVAFYSIVHFTDPEVRQAIS